VGGITIGLLERACATCVEHGGAEQALRTTPHAQPTKSPSCAQRPAGISNRFLCAVSPALSAGLTSRPRPPRLPPRGRQVRMDMVPSRSPAISALLSATERPLRSGPTGSRRPQPDIPSLYLLALKETFDFGIATTDLTSGTHYFPHKATRYQRSQGSHAEAVAKSWYILRVLEEASGPIG
jgi:hypothetical protein